MAALRSLDDARRERLPFRKGPFLLRAVLVVVAELLGLAVVACLIASAV